MKNTEGGGYLSAFTGWGPTYEVDLQPEVGAPGGQILSTYPLDLGGYAVISGASMACPHISGIIALLLEARGKTDPATINNILAATADPNIFFGGINVQPYLAPVMRQGAGLVNPYDAVLLKLSSADRAYLSTTLGILNQKRILLFKTLARRLSPTSWDILETWLFIPSKELGLLPPIHSDPESRQI